MFAWARSNHLVRSLAALAAGLLISTHVLAAASACIVFAKASPTPVHAQCPDDDAIGSSAPAEVQHCPTEDPTAQARSIELPSAVVVPVFQSVFAVVLPESAAPPASADAPPPLPRFEELNRLLL